MGASTIHRIILRRLWPAAANRAFDFVTFLTGEMVAVQAVVTFHMVDRGLNGRPAFEHTADGAG